MLSSREKEVINLLKIRIKFIIFISVLVCFSTEALTQNIYDQVVIAGDEILNEVLKGNFKYFNKNQDNLNRIKSQNIKSYKRDKKSKKTSLYEMRFLEPTNEDSLFFYQLVAFEQLGKKEYEYYFVAVLMLKADKNGVRIVNNWLITETDALKEWWRKEMAYWQSESIKEIPEKYVYKVCPPPPLLE